MRLVCTYMNLFTKIQ